VKCGRGIGAILWARNSSWTGEDARRSIAISDSFDRERHAHAAAYAEGG
jgi:hypothetical protein